MSKTIHYQKILTVIAIAFTMFGLGLYVLTVSASGRATITVTNTNDAGAGSLRQAILDASPGSLVTFSNGLAGQTIALTSGSLVIDKSLTVEADSTNPVKLSGSNQLRVLEIANGTEVTLRNLTVRDGRDDLCAGINSSGTLLLDNVTVSGNQAFVFGGGLCVFGPGVTIENSRFANNQLASQFRDGGRGSSNGAAIFTSANSVIIRDSVFTGNDAGFGGISDLYQTHSSSASDPSIGKIEISNSTFDGAILNGPNSAKPASSLKIENTIIDGGELLNGGQMIADNLTVRNGAGFSNFHNGGSAIISNSLFENNSYWSGGGIQNGGILELSNSAVVSNTATDRGGGISNFGVMTLTNVTVSGNQAGVASAIFQETASSLQIPVQPMTYLNNVTIAGNGGAAANVISADSAQSIQFRNTIIADNSNVNNCAQVGNTSSGLSLGNSLSDDATCTMDNASDMSNAGNALLATLSDNGSDTLTHALNAGSGAIDAGDSATCAFLDQRGYPRLVDGNADSEAICDMGAFEYLSVLLVLNEKVYLPIVVR